MVWGAFSAKGPGPISQVVGIMNAQKYIEILENNLEKYLHENMAANYTFQQDNDPKHAAKATKAWFEQKKIKVMEWPAQSADLNPIENLWDYIDRRLKAKQIDKLQHLYPALEEIWKNIPKDFCKKLVDSMPNRCRMVIANKGYKIDYWSNSKVGIILFIIL